MNAGDLEQHNIMIKFNKNTYCPKLPTLSQIIYIYGMFRDLRIM